MESQPPPPKPQAPKPPPSYLYLFKILDHCGCMICATYYNNMLQTLQYYSACDICSNKLSYQQYVDIYHMCADEVQRHSIKELTHHRGWINKHEAAKILQNLNISSNMSNAKLLIVRMELAAGKIENVIAVDDDANPS